MRLDEAPGLIAVSGIDGSGKSTLVGLLAAALRERGVAVCTLSALKPAEKVPLGWLDGLGERRADPAVEVWIAGLFSLALLHNVRTRVEPALAGGSWVVADRWLLDHRVNQEALGGDLGPWESLLAAVPEPDLHLVVTVPVEVALRRVEARGERSGIGTGAPFLTRSAGALARRTPATAHVLDGRPDPAAVLGAALDRLEAARV